MNPHTIVHSVVPGDLVFDIGAHAGEKAEWFRQRGARVICLEPQPALIQTLQKRFAGQPQVEIVGEAVGATPGELPLSICTDAPTISTLAESWKQGRFSNQTWDRVVNVPVTTLDALVARFGVPRYTKIDVEGYEKQVLAGLSRRIGIVSYEFTAEYIDDAFEVVGQLVKLGYTRFNLSVGEESRFALSDWVPFHSLVCVLARSAQEQRDLWGDIYAN